MDEDDSNIDFASTVTFMKGTNQEYIYCNYPKEEIEIARANTARKETEEAAVAAAAAASMADQRGEGGGAGPSNTGPVPLSEDAGNLLSTITGMIDQCIIYFEILS